jgi:hypothetical protein
MKQIEISWHCESIVSVLSEYPEGIGISRLQQVLSTRCGSIGRRTLQRRLERLARDGRVAHEGQNAARLYRPGAFARLPARLLEEPGAHYRVDIVHVPVSREGEEIRAQIRKPLSFRSRVEYERKFLESYVPGFSRYLPWPVLSHLHEIGRMSGTGAAGFHSQGILDRLRVDFSWASSRLEGSTYTRPEAEALIVSGKPAPGKHALETRTVLNHADAFAMLTANVGRLGLDAFTLKSLHAMLSPDAWPRPAETSGMDLNFSTMAQFVEERFSLLLKKAADISDPFEQAFFVMAQIPYLQPFPDANKPVSRLAANIPLLSHSLCPLTFADVPALAYTEGTLGIYELGRVELLRDVFVWAYERSCLRNRKGEAAPPG